MNVLAADIGGTHARFALVRAEEGGGARIRARATYSSAELDSLLDGARRFLGSSADRTVEAVCVAVAGPVEGGVARLTNLDWEVREDSLSDLPGVHHVRVMNDFEALGHAVPLLSGRDLVVVHPGRPDPRGPRVVLGAGTGLGQALVIPAESGSGVRVYPTEGGHATFAPRDDEEWALRDYLSRRHGHVSWERVLSGSGLHAIYRYLVDSGIQEEDDETRRAMSRRDPAAVVSERGADGADPACARALELFVSCYGARAGDMALSVGATGGVYVAGGIAPRLRDHMAGPAFVDAFLAKGRMAGWLERIPVRLVVRDDAALLGAVAGCGAPCQIALTSP